MADEEARELQLIMITKKHANNNDIDFMELIREFPTIYNKKTKDFHDKRKKENFWKTISELLNTTTQEVERRYKTIRTSFTSKGENLDVAYQILVRLIVSMST